MAPTQHSQLWGGLPALSIAVRGSDHVEVLPLTGTGIFVVTLLGLGPGCLLSLPQNQPAGEKEHIPAFLGTGGRWESRCEEASLRKI